MIKLDPGDLLVEKDGSHAILIERTSWGEVGAFIVFWNNGKEDLFPWVETSIKSNIQKGDLKHLKGDC